MTVYLAPLEGVTDAVFRRVHRDCFSGVAKYFIPFVSPTQNLAFTARDLSILAPENGFGVPQLLCKDAALFLWAAQALGDMGYGEVNLNLGCPSGTVTAKGKGSGLLADVPALERLLDGVFSRSPLPVSIKTRIGYTRPDELTACWTCSRATPSTSSSSIRARASSSTREPRIGRRSPRRTRRLTGRFATTAISSARPIAAS